jgi:hypothetical protein
MGSTACVAVIKSSRFSVANVGHSRCVISKKGKVYDLLLIKACMNLADTFSFHSKSIPTVPKICLFPLCQKGIELSNEHKAFEPGESRRIIKAGGRVWKDKIVLIGERIPLLGISKVAGVLAIPRAIGILLCVIFFNSRTFVVLSLIVLFTSQEILHSSRTRICFLQNKWRYVIHTFNL